MSYPSRSQHRSPSDPLIRTVSIFKPPWRSAGGKGGSGVPAAWGLPAARRGGSSNWSGREEPQSDTSLCGAGDNDDIVLWGCQNALCQEETSLLQILGDSIPPSLNERVGRGSRSVIQGQG